MFCVHFRTDFLSVLHRFTQDYDTKTHIFSFHSPQRQKLHKGQSNWFSSNSVCWCIIPKLENY